MDFNPHYELRGKHALLSPSSSAWLRYSQEKLLNFIVNNEAKKRGTRLHEWACETIKLKKRQVASDALGMYINYAIDNDLTPEQPLKFSDECYGTADSIGFNGKTLIIADYKSGVVGLYEETEKDFEQLLIYAALFCLEYHINPKRIKVKLRIFQAEKKLSLDPDHEVIENIMSIIIDHANTISTIDRGGLINV